MKDKKKPTEKSLKKYNPIDINLYRCDMSLLAKWNMGNPPGYTLLYPSAKVYGQAGTNQYGKIDVTITKQKRPKKIYAKVEIKSAFPGGDSSWIKSFESRLNQSIPFRNGAKKGQYLVTVAFIVTKDGTISEIRSLTDPGFGMGEAVIRTLKKGPRWTPAPPDGIKVRVKETINIPI